METGRVTPPQVKTPPHPLFLLAAAFFIFTYSFSEGAVAAKDKSGAPGDVEAVADQLEYAHQGKKIIAKGNVVITYGDVKMTSDYAEVETDTKQSYARGHVVIIREDRVASKGEEVHYNFETEEGSFPDGRVTEGTWFAGGRDVKQIKRGKLKIQGAEITTCRLERPHYSLRAKEVTVYSGDKIFARNVTFLVLGKPVFWLPYLIIPLHELIDSPLIIQPGYSSQYGAYVLTSKGFSVTKWLWGKWHADYRFKRGFGGGADLDYQIARLKSQGNLRMYLTQDKDAPIPGRLNPYEEREDRTRGRITWRHRTDFNPNTYALIRFHNLSDEFFLQDFFQREFRADVEPTSFVNFTANSDRHGFYAYNQARIRNFETTVERLPEIRFDWKNAPFLKSKGLYYKSQTSFANLNQRFTRSNLNFNLTRADTFHEWTYPLKWNEIKLTPSSFFRETIYSRDAHDGDARARTAFGGAVDLRTQFYRLFNTSFDVLGIEANQLRHVFEPSVRYDTTWLSTISNEELTKFDSVDSVDDANRVTFGIENRIQTKRVVAGKMQRVDLVSLNTFLSYDFHPDEEFSRSGFSIWSAELQVRPYEWLQYEIRSEYDMFRDKFKDFNQDILAKKGRFRVVLGHRLVSRNDFLAANGNNQFVFDVKASLNTRWALGGYLRWNAQDQKLEEWQISATRDLHDFLLDFGYNVRNSIIRESNKELFFVFRLKAFPQYDLKSGNRASFSEPRIGSTVAGSSTVQAPGYVEG